MPDMFQGLEERLARRDAQGAIIVGPHEYNEPGLLSMLDHLVGPGRYLVHWNRDRGAGSRWPHAYVWAELGWWWKAKKAEAIEQQIRVAFDLWIPGAAEVTPLPDTVERQPSDGDMGVYLDRKPGALTIVVTDMGVRQVLHCSKFNARRVLAALSMILELPLSKAAQKQIKL